MWVRIALFLSVAVVTLLMVGAVVGYYLLKYVFRGLRTDHFDAYSNETRKIIDRYRSAPIRRAFVLQRRIPQSWRLGVGALRLFISTDLCRSTLDAELFHQGLLVEVATAKGPRFLIVEKTCELVVRDAVKLTPAHTMRPLALSTDEHTVDSLLASTQGAMGDEHFFNWRTDSTCQRIVAEMAKQLDSDNAVTSPNGFDGVSEGDAYILNKMLYYYYKVMRLVRLDRQLLKHFT